MSETISTAEMIKKARKLREEHGEVDYIVPSSTAPRGNGYNILGEWMRQANMANWPHTAIMEIMEFAKADNYDHLREVIYATVKQS